MEGLHIPYNFHVSRDVAVLRLVPDDQLWRDDLAPSFDHSARLSSFPNLLIGESAARQLLSEAGLNLDQLLAALRAGERIELETGLPVRVEAGLAYEEVSAANVVGYFTGDADATTYGERILVAVAYGGPASREDSNVSGVAVMLEVARLWRDLEFRPKRTVVFAAFDEGGGSHFVQHPAFPVGRSDTWTAVVLHGVGVGGSQLARRGTESGLARSFDRSARRFGVRTQELEEWRFFFTSGCERAGHARSDLSYTGLAVARPEEESRATPTPAAVLDCRFDEPPDALDSLDQELLAEAGRTVAHYLMVLSSR